MAMVNLSGKAIGSKIYFQETASTKAGYIVAMHSYRGDNCLLVRCENLPAQNFYSSWTETASYDASALCKYLNETWVAGLSAEAASLLASVTLPNKKSYRAFIPSCCEFGLGSSGSYDERDSVILSTAAIEAIAESRKGTEVWTRDIEDTGEQNEDGSWDVCYDSARYLKISSSGSVTSSYSSVTNTKQVLVCIAVPENLVLDSNDVLRANHAPVIRCEYYDGEDLGSRSKPFRFTYSVTDEDGDPLTVYETVATTVIKTYSPANGAENAFIVTQAIYDALQTDQYYELTICATDGLAVTYLRLRFLKSNERGYRVYAGTTTTTVNGTSIAQGGYTFSEKVCIYDPAWRDETRMIFDPNVIFEVNDFGSFEFTLPKENVYYDKIDIRKTIVTVEEDGEHLWTGYVVELSKDFKMDKLVYCRGEMGYLEDLACKVTSKEWTAGNLFTTIVNSTYADGIKSFRVGTIDPDISVEKVDLTGSGTQYTTVWGALHDILLAKVGGIIRLRIRRDKTENYGIGYTRYLDFLAEPEEKTNQTIEFGRNLLDLNYYMSGYDIVNQIVVYGYETTGWWFWKKTSPISVTVRDDASIAKYGLIERSVFVEGTKSETEDLRAVGKKKLKEMSAGLAGGIEISALDLKDAGVDVNRLGFLKQTRILSVKHDIDTWEYCSKLELPLDDPAGKKFTFGQTIDAISVQQASDSTSTRKALAGMESIIGYINGNS